MRETLTREDFSAFGRHAAAATLRTAWTLIRLPLLALLVILEPVVRVVLTGLALLVTLTAFFWLALRGLSAFPFWGMLGLGVSALLLLALYYALMRLLSA